VERSRDLYPVSLDLQDRQCLVVGGGPVAARKTAGLVRSGAEVTVVAPRIDPAIESLEVHIERRPYRPGEAGAYQLVLTTTGVPAVDRAVAADAEAAGRWVNSADDAEHCSFLLPAVHRQGSVTVAVSTGGASPALARWLRTRIAGILGGELGQLARLLEDARRRLRAAGRSTESVDWERLLDGPLPELLRRGLLDEARALLEEAIG
jgi:siroheme synthase-like protein